MSKVSKELIKSVKEATRKESSFYSKNGKWYCKGKEFDSMEEALDYEYKEKMKAMTPKQRAVYKEKQKKELAKRKVQDKKNEEKWAKQRAKRGFSDDMVWSIDYTLLRLIPDMIDELVKNMNGFQPQLGYKYDKKLKKVVKLKKQLVKDPYSGKIVRKYPDITMDQEKEVLKYLSDGFRQLYAYLNMDDIDYSKEYTTQEYKNRMKKWDELHEEIFDCFKDVFYSLWD